MKKYLLLLMSLVLLSVVIADLQSGTTAYYSEDSDWSDSLETYTATNNGATPSSTGIISNSFYYDGTDDYTDISTLPSDLSTHSWAISVWGELDYWGSNQCVAGWSDKPDGTTSYWEIDYNTADSKFYGRINVAGVENNVPSTSTYNNNADWHHFVLIGDSQGHILHFYIDGSDQGSNSGNDLNPSDMSYFYVGQLAWSSANINAWNGYIDELAIFNYDVNSEVSYLYNSGSPGVLQQYPFTELVSDNFTVSVFDAWDSSAVNNVTVSIGGVDYTNTSGNRVTTLIYVNDSSTYDINISNFEHFDSFYYDVNVSSALSAYMNASDVKFRGFNIFGEEFNSNFTIDSTTKGSNESFYLSSGNHSVTVSSTGYFPYSEVVNVSPLDNKTINITGLYTINLSIHPRDVLNNNSILGVNITLKNTSRGFSQSFTNVSEGLFSVMEGCYNLTLVASGRNDLTESICLNTSGNLTYYSYMYAFNSLWVYAYDLLSGNNISDFNITVQNANYSYSNNSISGVARLSNILSGTYDVFVSSSDYDSASYVVTVTDNSFQTLDAYLIKSNGTFIFTVQDKATGGSLEGASIAMKRYINSTLTTVAVKYSDITGRAEFDYNDGIVYYFTLLKNGYDTKDFSLEILFDSYTVLMTPSSSMNESVYLDDVSFNLVGAEFVNSTSWVSYYFNSPLGSLENYNLSILLNNGSVFTSSGSSTGGSVLNVSVSTPSAQFGDVALVYLNYKSSFNAGVSSYSFIFPFETFTPSSSSLYFFKSDLADSSDLSKSIWGSIVVLVVVAIFGVFGLFLGDILLTGSIGGVFGFVVVAVLGLFNWVVASIAIFILIMLIIGRVVSSG